MQELPEVMVMGLKVLEKHGFKNPTHTVWASKWEEAPAIFISFLANRQLRRLEVTHFDLQVEGDIAYLLHLKLYQPLRGRGMGKALLRAAEEIVANLGCKKLQLTPSGTTFTGKSRKQWYVDQGYQEAPDNIQVFKLLVPSEPEDPATLEAASSGSTTL